MVSEKKIQDFMESMTRFASLVGQPGLPRFMGFTG
jgi:hypothetical protein